MRERASRRAVEVSDVYKCTAHGGAGQALDIFRASLPNRPYCSNDLEQGLIIRPGAHALAHRYIQPNPPTAKRWLVFDVDRQGAAYSWEDANLPAPTIITTNPANGHAHILYGLTVPVVTTEAGRAAPLRYAAAVEAVFCERLDSDSGYSGLITKNPFNPAWGTLTPGKLYELGELADWVDLNTRRDKREVVGLGRNCTLFNDLRHWAYSHLEMHQGDFDSWLRALQRRAGALNAFPQPLPKQEVAGIARSVGKWTWTRYRGRLPDQQFSYRQAVRGSLGGRPMTAGLPGHRPWEEMGLSYSQFRKQVTMKNKMKALGG